MQAVRGVLHSTGIHAFIVGVLTTAETQRCYKSQFLDSEIIQMPKNAIYANQDRNNCNSMQYIVPVKNQIGVLFKYYICLSNLLANRLISLDVKDTYYFYFRQFIRFI